MSYKPFQKNPRISLILKDKQNKVKSFYTFDKNLDFSENFYRERESNFLRNPLEILTPEKFIGEFCGEKERKNSEIKDNFMDVVEENGGSYGVNLMMGKYRGKEKVCNNNIGCVSDNSNRNQLKNNDGSTTGSSNGNCDSNNNNNNNNNSNNNNINNSNNSQINSDNIKSNENNNVFKDSNITNFNNNNTIINTSPNDNTNKTYDFNIMTKNYKILQNNYITNLCSRNSIDKNVNLTRIFTKKDELKPNKMFLTNSGANLSSKKGVKLLRNCRTFTKINLKVRKKYMITENKSVKNIRENKENLRENRRKRSVFDVKIKAKIKKKKNKERKNDQKEGYKTVESLFKKRIRKYKIDGESLFVNGIRVQKRYRNLSLDCSLINLTLPQTLSQLDTSLLSALDSLSKETAKVALLNSRVADLSENFLQKSEKVSEKLRKISENDAMRRELNEELHKLRGNIRVFCRVKPHKPPSILSFPEIGEGKSGEGESLVAVCLRGVGNGEGVRGRGRNESITFTLDRVLPPSCSQSAIYAEVEPFIQSAIDGEDACIFAYGATGSGKTFTMQGEISIGKTGCFVGEKSGILPRSAQFIFKEKERLKFVGVELEMKMSAFEIYMEKVYDLMKEGKDAKGKKGVGKGVGEKKGREALNIIQKNSEIVIDNLTILPIKSEIDIINNIETASKNRKTDSTDFNQTSSRSHALFRIHIFNSKTKKKSIINIVDLAGSEKRQIRTGNEIKEMNKEEKEKMKKIQEEANSINNSLTSLGIVLKKIGEMKKNNKITSISYRDSTLTRVLQNSLTVKSKTIMIVNISGEGKDYNSTKQSLEFAKNAMVNC